MKFSQMLKQKLEEIQKSKNENDYQALIQDNDDLIALNQEVINQKERIQNYDDDILSNFENKDEHNDISKNKEKPKEQKRKEDRVYQNMKQYKSDLLIQSQKQKEKEELEQIIQSSSIDEVKDIWSYLKSFGEKQVHSQVLTNQIPKYQPTQNDYSNVYYGDLLKKLYGKDWKQKECHQEVSDEFKVHTATQFFQDEDTGERYLMQYQVQYFQHEKHTNKNASIISIAFLFFNQEIKQFQLKSQFLLDVYDQYKLNKQSMYNFVLNKGCIQYYYMKKRTRLNDKWFQTLELFQQKVRCSSKYDFLGEPAGNDELQTQQLEQLTIVLPLDCQMRLEELEYSFLIDANFNQNKKNQVLDKNFINNQFVLVRSIFNTHYDLNEEERIDRLKKNEILIYSLNETSKPILRIEEIEFESILLGFFTQIDDKMFVFSLKGQSKHYEIKFNQDDYFIYKQYSKQTQQDLLDRNDLKIENIKKSFYKAFLQQLEPLHIEIQKQKIDKNDKKYKQSYFISDDGDIELIYPLQSQEHKEKIKGDNTDSLTNYEIALHLINEKHKIVTGGYIQLCTLYFDYQIDYAVRNEQMMDFLDSIQPIPSSKYMSICCTKDTVVCSNYYGCINIYLINDCQEQGYFENYKLEQEHTMLDNILQNFDWKKQSQIKQQKNNYEYEDDNHVSNEFLESYYLNKRKQGVISTHNKVWVNQNLYQFERNRLIIDLSQNSQEKEPFYLLDLFQESIQDVQLLKYHTTNLSAIFFFLQRNKFWINEEGKKVQNSELSGVHFFVIMPIQQLKLLKLEQKPILEKGSVVYIPINIDNIKKVNYDWQEMLKYQDNSKNVSFTHTHLDFEMVRDLRDPTNDWFPFVYYNWVNQNRYNQYFCFMNVEKLGYKLHYQELQEKDVKIDFSENILIFKINYFKNESEHKDLKDCQGKNIYRLNVLQSKNRNSNKISRCSNWQKNMQNKSKNLKSLQYSARFQIGTNVNFQSISTIEIKEFLITIDKSENYFNQDQLFFYNTYQQDLSQEIKPKNNSYINFTPIQQRFCIKSQQFMQNQISSNENITPFENERILPKMDDNGNINGSFLLLNNIQNLYGTYKLTNDLQVIRNLHAQQIYIQLESKLDQIIFVTKKEDNCFEGIFQDGTVIQKIKYEATVEFIEFKKSVKLDSNQKYLHAFNQMRNPIYIYQLLEVDDEINNQTHFIKGPITTMKLKTFSFFYQPFNQIFLCSTMFNKDIIQSNYFDKSESTYWLYHFSRILICMSQPNFEEVFNISNDNKIARYFQPRFILNGNSICYLDFDFYGFSINNLKQAFENKLCASHKYLYLENSSIYYAAISNESQCHKNMDNFVNSFYVNKFHYLQYDSLRFISVIEQSISANKMKAATYIVEYMLQNFDQDFFIKALTTDLPQILCSQKININEFLNVSPSEDTLIAQEQNHLSKNKNYKSKITIVNLEQFLIDPTLPTFGPEEIHTFFIKNFNSSFWTEEEIIYFIDQEDQKDQKINDHGGNLVSIEYSMLNFQPMIRKLKIDKILGQKGSIEEHTEYRDLVKGKPQDIKYIDDLFLASILLKNIENSKFFLNSTINKLIQNQFEKVRPIVKSFLYFYIIGFVIPFLISTLIYDQIDSSQESQWELYFKYSLLFIAAFTQIIFAIFEYADIRINGILSYISNGFNLMDSSQFVLYSINIYIRLYGQDLNQNMMHLLFDKILQIVILLQSTTRILQYIRFNDDFSFLVQMIIRVLIDLLPFLTIFMLYIFVFSIIIIILGGDFDAEGYQLMPKYLRIGIQIFRNAIGDIAVIDYGIWKDDEDKAGFSSAQPIAVFLIWAIWLLYIFFMLIVMLNFIIAEVGDTYNTVKEQGVSLLNKQKLELNNLVFQIQDLFGLRNQFRCIVYQVPHQNINVDEESVADQINANTNKSLVKMKRELLQVIDKLKEENQKENQIILKAVQKQPVIQEDQEGQVNQLEDNDQQSVSLVEIQKKQDKLIDLVSAYNEKVDQQTNLISKLVDQDVGNMEIMMQMMNNFQNQNQ